MATGARTEGERQGEECSNPPVGQEQREPALRASTGNLTAGKTTRHGQKGKGRLQTGSHRTKGDTKGMETQHETMPIKASIHPSTVKRVSRMFPSNLKTILAETFQNARRANASRVRVGIEASDQGSRVTIGDDGDGVASPEALLWYGMNGWDQDTIEREDAAGMGILSLAQRGCVVETSVRGEDRSWRVELRPENFTGEKAATVERTQSQGPGTTVRFEVGAEIGRKAIRHAVRYAAWYYPMPVVVHENGREEEIEDHGFLAGAYATVSWKGIRIGVFENYQAALGRHLHRPWETLDTIKHDLNFHGLTMEADMPKVDAVGGESWHSAVDIVDCPALELVLPARQEVVENGFIRELRDRARQAIWEAMASHPEPRPSFADWTAAKARGIEMDPAPARLQPWTAREEDGYSHEGAAQPEKLGERAAVFAVHLDPPTGQAVARAAAMGAEQENPAIGKLFKPDPKLAGYPWYDDLPVVHEVRIEAGDEANRCEMESWRTGQGAKPARVEKITVILGIAEGTAMREVVIESDVAFAGERFSEIEHCGVLVTEASTISFEELATIMCGAYFRPADPNDPDSESWERQKNDFDIRAREVATTLLVSGDEAVRNTIAEAVRREVLWRIPVGQDIDIAVRGKHINVRLGGMAGACGSADTKTAQQRDTRPDPG